MSETDRHVVEKPIVGLCDGFEGTSHDDDHVEEKERVVFIIHVGRTTPCFTAAVVNRVALLHHLQSSCSVKLGIMHGGQKLLR